MTNPLQQAKNQQPPEYAYHVLRSALEKYGKGVAELSSQELATVCQRADKSYSLESKVLNSQEAQGVVISNEQVEAALTEVVGRYADHDEFVDDLTTNGITEDAMKHALYRELAFDAVMNKVAANSAAVSDLDVQLFYQMHKERFSKPEIRYARHILITVNDDYADNQRERALERIQDLQRRLKKNPSNFGKLAMQHSECPTAMQGGSLGAITSNSLFPELDKALFNMKAGQVSDVIESELGFHILFCEKIEAPRQVNFAEAKNNVRHLLEERQRKNCQKAWLKNLGEKANGA